MHRHLFLTGQKHIGKSTAIGRFLKESGLETAGFRTVRTDAVIPGQRTVHMLRAGTREAPDRENLLFVCGRRDAPEIASRFDDLGCGLLDEITDFSPTKPGDSTPLILMDELGPSEHGALDFRESVLEVMRGDKPVLGVLQENCPEWFELLRADHRLLLITVTEENRDLVPGRIADWYQTEWLEPACEEVRDSYGAVVFDEDETGLYVLMIGSLKGWSFPKGHGRVGEDPSDAAAREIYEETGIRAEIDAGFSGVVPSILKGDDRTVTFFAGRSLDGRKIPIPMEVPGAQWVKAEEAANLIRFETDRQVYLDALAYRRSHSR